MDRSFETPILLILFNRPEFNDGLISILREVKPRELYIAADGPRPNVQEDIDNCAKSRHFIELVDWDCKLHTAFQEKNLGCGKGVSKAITWFLSQVPEGIIIEDDCFPNKSFFLFCQELLGYYRNDERIMAITGTNDGRKTLNESDSYLFSQIPNASLNLSVKPK